MEWPKGETHSMPVFIPPDKFFASGAGDIGAAVIQVKKDGDDYAGRRAVEKPGDEEPLQLVGLSRRITSTASTTRHSSASMP